MEDFVPDKVFPATIQLDVMFGEALDPNRVDPLEKTLQPRSLHELSDHTAALLKGLMRITEDGLGTTRYVYSELPILWVVDRGGKLWFSIEEIVSLASSEYIFPRARRFQAMEGRQKLGHPSLIGAGPGRIGGEILFDLGHQPSGAWFITNRSGRYGQRVGRTAHHLSNAAKAFAGYGIDLREQFLPPMVRDRT